MREPEQNVRLRGLVVNQKFAHRFITSGKQWELRTTQCRCVKKDENFYLVESGIGHNRHGVSLFRVIAELKMKGQHKLTWPEIEDPSSFQKHCCTMQEIVALKAMWKDKPSIYAWHVSVVRVLVEPWYIRSGSQDSGHRAMGIVEGAMLGWCLLNCQKGFWSGCELQSAA